MRAARAAAVVISLALTAGGCTRRNERYCCTTEEACNRPGGDGQITPCTDPERPFCDNDGVYPASGGVGRTCIPLPGEACTGQTCDDPDMPICYQGVCVECGDSADCGPEAPVCGELDHQCGACSAAGDCARFADRPYCDQGACIGCRDAGDCSAGAPVCDPDDRVCRGCQDHGECGTGVCDLSAGACVAAGDILHVAPGGVDRGDCEAGAPCRTIEYAAGRVEGSRMWILVAPGGYTETALLTGVRARIVGPGAALSPDAAGVPILALSDSDVEVDGLELRQAGGGEPGSGDGVRCVVVGGTIPGRLVLRGVEIADNDGTGVESSGCELRIERSVIRGNRDGGLNSTGATLTVLNSFLVDNGDVDEATVGGARLVGPPGSRFEHNTVVGNKVADGITPGVQCSSNGELVLRNNIVFGNSPGNDDPQVAGNCGHEYSLIGPIGVAGDGNLLEEEPLFAGAGAGDYHLAPDSPGIDAAAASDVAVDYDGQDRPAGAAPDMGADEVQ